MNPNIIILISDALRTKDLSLYGRKKTYDPNLREIARENILFLNNFTTSNGSDPSVTSLFSGQYPTTSGFIHQHPFMRGEEIEKLKKNKFWLPLYLQRRDYDTISATPMHLWFKKGFNSYTDKEQLKSGRFLDTPFVKRLLLGLPNWMYSLGKKMTKFRASPQFYPAPKVVDFAISKIKKNQEEKKPFFMFMHLVDTHYPYALVPLPRKKGRQTPEEIVKDLPTSKQREYVKKRFYDVHASTLEQIEQKRDDSIAAVDKEIMRLYQFIKNRGLLENTLIFILSDHGDNFGEHNAYFCRGGLYDSSIKVPLIVHIPKLKPAVIDELTQNIDISATILDYVNDGSIKMDGKSLLSLIKKKKRIHDSLFFIDAFCDSRYAIRNKKEKFIYSKSGKCYLCGSTHSIREREVYDISRDEAELSPLKEESKRMEKKLRKFIKP